MPGAAPGGLVYGCLTHIPLWLEFPSYVTPIYSGDAQKPGQFNLRDLAPEWNRFHPVLGGSAGAFALKNYVLKHRPDATQIGICQYRKLITRERIGVPAKNYEVMDVVTKAAASQLALADAMLPETPFLIGRLGQFAMNGVNYDYLYQYKDVHHVEDLLRFTAEAVELGVISKQDVHPFFAEKLFFPGGVELGFFPADFWIQTMMGLETVVRACVYRYPTRREGLQGRLWSFCMERLGSYLLLKYLRCVHREGWNQFTGFLNLITEDDDLSYVPGI
jgi:hypothetical protein